MKFATRMPEYWSKKTWKFGWDWLSSCCITAAKIQWLRVHYLSRRIFDTIRYCYLLDKSKKRRIGVGAAISHMMVFAHDFYSGFSFLQLLHLYPTAMVSAMKYFTQAVVNVAVFFGTSSNNNKDNRIYKEINLSNNSCILGHCHKTAWNVSITRLGMFLCLFQIYTMSQWQHRWGIKMESQKLRVYIFIPASI